MPKSCRYGKLKGDAISYEHILCHPQTRFYIAIEICQNDCALVFLKIEHVDEQQTIQFDECIPLNMLPKGYIASRDYINFLAFYQGVPPPEEHANFMLRALSSIIAREAKLTIAPSIIAHTVDDELIVFSIEVGHFTTEAKVPPDSVSTFIQIERTGFDIEVEETTRFERYVERDKR